MISFIDSISDEFNIRFAWEKVKNEANPSDIWNDEIELAAFELELEANLDSIKKDFRKCNYELKPIKPLPYPKHKDTDGNLRLRQIFQISVRDQVAWTAIVNVIGPLVDIKMPSWSYGNRLFRSIWIEEEEDGSLRRKIGRYRHAAGRQYLPFRQSWPVFKRHIYLTTRAMIQANTSIDDLPDLDEQTKNEEQIQQKLMENEYTAQAACPYLKPDYWEKVKTTNKEEDMLYWCSIDLEKFYPSIQNKTVIEKILKHIPYEWKTEAENILNMMIKFPVSLNGWENADLKKIGLRKNQKFFISIPTGLYVAGFLANAAMLDVDIKVHNSLSSYPIAHFRYVDDHIILAYNFDDLLLWIQKYEVILKDGLSCAKFNWDKITPPELGKYLKKLHVQKQKYNIGGLEKEKIKTVIIEACKLDARYPSPLMTKTLALISGLTRVDFNLLESSELEAVTEQLEHLLLVDVAETEIPEKTRLSFSATRLIKIAECRLSNPEDYTLLNWELLKLKTRETKPEESNAAKLNELTQRIDKSNKLLVNETNRAFQLIFKVLRARPERIRLWTQAIEMCRVTGAHGIRSIFKELRIIEKNNNSYADYLWAIVLTKISSECIIAAKIVIDEGSAAWRIKSADNFLREVISLSTNEKLIDSDIKIDRDFLIISRQQLIFSIFCVKQILRDSVRELILFSDKMIKFGEKISKYGTDEHDQIDWVWWASRNSLINLSPFCDNYITMIARELNTSKKANVFWRIFPYNIPIENIINFLLEVDEKLTSKCDDSGWLYEVLIDRNDSDALLTYIENTPRYSNVTLSLNNNSENTISLYEWCLKTEEFSIQSNIDPRCTEWTALEIIKKIINIIQRLVEDEEKNLVNLLEGSIVNEDIFSEIHPGNFRIPKSWINMETIPSWAEWREYLKNESSDKVVMSEKGMRLYDERYYSKSEDFRDGLVNRFRGFGLMLFGLLRKSFKFPAMWNGVGNSKILKLFPSLLLSEVTCSSITLGILQACLNPRVTENAYLKRISLYNAIAIDEDTSRDPVIFETLDQLLEAITSSQDELNANQLSTLNFHARQLTPIDISQLITPDWKSIFYQGKKKEE